MKQILRLSTLVLAVFLAFASTGNAAPVVTILAGTSVTFQTFAVASQVSPVCNNGPNFWSQAPTAGNGVLDPRLGAVPPESGNIWVSYDGLPNGTTATHICAYVSMDSVIANRLFFGTAGGGIHGIFNLGGVLVGTGAVPLVADNAPGGDTLPGPIVAAVNGVQIAAAVSDVRPEDALFIAMREWGIYGPLGPPAGYPAGVSTRICSAYSPRGVLDVLYTISGADPISGIAVAPYSTITLGAAPMMFFGNTSGAAAGDLGFFKANPAVTFGNLDTLTIASVWAGYVDKTYDLVSFKAGVYPVGGGLPPFPGNPLTVLTREPISSAYNVVEWQVVRSRQIGLDQEIPFIAPIPQNGACPVPPPIPPSGNPAYAKIATGANWGRVVGAPEMAQVANGINNAVGYAFWNYREFDLAPININYFSVDGADPLLPAYAGGNFPACAVLPCPVLPFPNIKNGGYRSWNMLRVITSPAQAAPGANVATLVNNTQDVANAKLSDFVPYLITNGTVQNLSVFRSHYAAPFNPPAVCAAGLNINSPVIGIIPPAAIGCPEGGGDMAGMPGTWQNDYDSFLDTGHGELIGFIQ